MSTRRAFVGGNWKCNGTRQSIEQLVKQLNTNLPPQSIDTVVAPTYIHLDLVKQSINQQYKVSAQNASATNTGAYTGEIAASQIADFGLSWVILGHSERRQLYGATDDVIAKQITEALKAGLSVIACVGETLAERKADQTWAVVERQLNAIKKVVGNQWSKIVIAYEPVWAIGTGETATPQQAQEVHAQIRKWLQSIDQATADQTRVIYGGSVKGNNAAELYEKPDIDGFLVGGASLIADEFGKICQATTRAKAKL